MTAEKAVELRASDIHIRALSQPGWSLMRIERLAATGPRRRRGLAASRISRIKIVANLNIAERRPSAGRAARLRGPGVLISTFGCYHGRCSMENPRSY